MNVARKGNPPLPDGPVIVTGSRGRLASHLADALAAEGVDVIRVSRRAGEGHISYDTLSGSGALDRAASLIHCAWSCLPATAEKHPESVQTEDLPLLRRLLEAASSRRNTEPVHFVFLSSGGAVYGECAHPAVETSPLAPVGHYGRGKVAAEQMLAAQGGAPGASLCILRPSNPYGFRHVSEKPQGIVGAALQAVRSGRPLELLGGGASLKDFLHVADFESAIMDCLRSRLDGTYNICHGDSVRTLDVITMLEEIGRFEIPRVEVPPVDWDVHCSLLSRDKFTAATGWEPARDLRRGLGEALREAGFNVSG